MTRINSWNEWDPLRHVIVGRIDSRMVGAPEAGIVNAYPRAGLAAGEWRTIPDGYLERAHEQMEAFVALFEQHGIRVDRPTSMDDRQYVRTPDWECDHMFGTMPPRDIIMCHGNEILEATMSQRARWFEFLAYKPLLQRYFKEDPDFLWSAAPKPRLSDASYVPGYWDDFHHTWSEDELMAKMERFEWQLTEEEPLFDVDERHLGTLAGEHLGDAVAHGASAHDCDFLVHQMISTAMATALPPPRHNPHAPRERPRSFSA